MFVKNWMTRDPLVVFRKTPVEEAIRTMREHRIRHLPVVEKDNRLVGIVTQTDLLQASPSPATSLSVWEINFLLARMQVREAMTEKVVVVEEGCPLEEAALVMAQHKIGCLPVVQGQQLVGILTETDMFNIFTDQLGARRGGARLTLLVKIHKGELASVASLIAELGGNITTLTTMPDQDPAYYLVTIKVEDLPKEQLVESLSEMVVQVLDARESPAWGSEGVSPYSWTLEA